MVKNRLLTVAVAAAVVTSSPVAAADLVRLGNLKFAHFGAIAYMKEIAPKYDLRIDERLFAKGIDILPAIVAGEIDMAASGADAAVAGRASGVPIYAVAGFAKGGARIVARPDAGIKSIADLKGKKVGVARGGAQELLLLAELAKHGLSWSDRTGKDVQIIYMAFPDLNQAIAAGSIDAMSQSEPQSSQAINKGFGVEVIKPYDTELGSPVRTLVLTESLYKTRPDVAERVLRCFVEATATFIANPDLAQAYVVDKIFKGQITKQDYQDAIGNSEFTYDLTVEHIQITTDLMQKYGVGRMEKPPKAEEWVKLDLLAKAKAALHVN
ncbi:ABC transporter substrate-binding protein [Azospirillum griseum]|uniref:Transporter substrate-binding domain-containing protein n=1 Tax=Azospirillum griseum TaxID=2496639 RepID=A0A431VBE2_9PROT|nr:ABC transporter substrate-binding protein [Azospirillum griseum]RTR15757.1 transporter substrate-binding domain-containing protein [Azospirillum griseum]